MGKSELHPSVQQFKEFVKKHPGIMNEVRQGKVTLQDLYEEWYILGEEDTRWERYRETDHRLNTDHEKTAGNKELLTAIMDAVKKVDANQLQKYIANLSEALGALQGVISQFQSNSTSNPAKTNQRGGMNDPFQFRKD